MEYPTFGGEDAKLQLCVQSLDRKGEVTTGNDRLRVLVSRTPKRHRSVTALNFFDRPPKTEAPPPPMPPMPTVVAAKRSLPRFLEVFAPLNACDSEGLSSSTVSTPSTSRSSLPVTPASPYRELRNDAMIHDQSRSYFPILPTHQKDAVQPIIDGSRAQSQQQHGLAEITPGGEDNEADWMDAPTLYDRSDRSLLARAMRQRENETNMLIMDGTFGRI